MAEYKTFLDCLAEVEKGVAGAPGLAHVPSKYGLNNGVARINTRGGKPRPAKYGRPKAKPGRTKDFAKDFTAGDVHIDGDTKAISPKRKKLAIQKYSESQPRDGSGRWVAAGADAGPTTAIGRLKAAAGRLVRDHLKSAGHVAVNARLHSVEPISGAGVRFTFRTQTAAGKNLQSHLEAHPDDLDDPRYQAAIRALHYGQRLRGRPVAEPNSRFDLYHHELPEGEGGAA